MAAWRCISVPVLCSGLGGLVVGGPSALGQCEIARLLASDGQPEDRFGFAVAIDDGVAVVGAHYVDDACEDQSCNSGAVYVYERQEAGWIETARLVPPDSRRGARFGTAVAIDGDVILVGAHLHLENDRAGAAYLYRWSGAAWELEQKIQAGQYDQFGWSVALDGEVAAVGGINHRANGRGSGAAYVYRFDGSGWAEEARLLASDGDEGDKFGNAVAIAGDVIVVGADGDEPRGEDSGSAYVFRFDDSKEPAWIEEARLVPAGGAAGDRFGDAVAVDRNRVLVSAPGHDEVEYNAGAAYVFGFDGGAWTEEAKLVASDGTASEGFGAGVALADRVAVVGAPSTFGRAYVYRRDEKAGWTERAMFGASDGEWLELFGNQLALDGRDLIVGAPSADDQGIRSGAAFVFRVRDCAADVDCDGAIGIADLLAVLAGWGDCPGPPDACPADVDRDGRVDLPDLLALLASWGACEPSPEGRPQRKD